MLQCATATTQITDISTQQFLCKLQNFHVHPQYAEQWNSYHTIQFRAPHPVPAGFHKFESHTFLAITINITVILVCNHCGNIFVLVCKHDMVVPCIQDDLSPAPVLTTPISRITNSHCQCPIYNVTHAFIFSYY